MSAPGQQLDDRFRTLGPIARGGMGRVHLCEDLVLRNHAAVKVLTATSRDMRQRFRDEAILLANVRHPHLVQVLGVGETDEGLPYLAMEHLGDSLDRRLKRDGPLHWRAVSEIARQVADALTTLHAAGVVHRDVKPNNIAELRGITGRVWVKLIDLGVARVEDLPALQQAGARPQPRRPTKEGKILGTPGYTPPEAGLCEPDARFDVYGLGATIFELCTGARFDPLDPKTMKAVSSALDLPDELEAIVSRALEVIPESRIPTAAKFVAELEALLARYPDDSGVALFDGCFELIELLGIGAKAEVYRAYDRGARREVALKVLRQDVHDNAEDRARFDREARALSALDHPSIPRLIECRTSAERRWPFIAMGLRGGRRAADFEPGARLPPSDVISVGQQLASALEAMHALGIIHRDLNRSNVLIDRSGPTVQASIVDLGQVDLLDAFYAGVDERYPTPPEARTRLGSDGLEHAQWTAPEARRGEGWTTKSDLYSLGLLLFILLTGKIPAKDERGEWCSPAKLVPESEGPLAEGILGALQSDPSKRLDAMGLLNCLQEAEFCMRLAELEESREGRREVPSPAANDDARTRPPRAIHRAGTVAAVAVLCLFSWSLGRGSTTISEEQPRIAAALISAADLEGAGESSDQTAPAEVSPDQPAEVSPDQPSDGSSDQPSEGGLPVIEEAEASRPLPTISHGEFRRRVRGQQAELDKCMHGSPPVTVRVSVSAAGRIVRVETGEASVLVELCLRDALGAIDFPRGQPSTHRITLGGDRG